MLRERNSGLWQKRRCGGRCDRGLVTQLGWYPNQITRNSQASREGTIESTPIRSVPCPTITDYSVNVSLSGCNATRAFLSGSCLRNCTSAAARLRMLSTQSPARNSGSFGRNSYSQESRMYLRQNPTPLSSKWLWKLALGPLAPLRAQSGAPMEFLPGNSARVLQGNYSPSVRKRDAEFPTLLKTTLSRLSPNS